MTVPVNPLESALAQMRSMAAEAAGGARSVTLGEKTEASGAGSFAAALKSSLDKISGDQQKAVGESQAFELGASNVSLNDVMINTQKANIGFQTAVQVRNRLVNAYNTISQITI